MMTRVKLFLFSWFLKRVEKSLKKRKAQGKDTILYLARLLVKELEASGYDMKTDYFPFYANLHVWDTGEISIDNIMTRVSIRGPLVEPIEIRPPE